MGMNSMFKGATVFNSACAHSTTSKTTVWNVAKVKDFGSMFEEARSFNQNIATWTLPAGATLIAAGTAVNSVNTVGGLMSMFKNAAVFNNGIFTLNAATGGQTEDSRDLTSMFEGAAAFNQDITGWVTTKVTIYTSMFKNAAAFNVNIVTWKGYLSGGIYFTSMFEGAVEFNQNLNNWQLGSTTVNANTGLSSMFSGASKFQQNLCGWNTRLINADEPSTSNNMFLNTQCPNPNVDFKDAGANDDAELIDGALVCCSCVQTNPWDTTTYPACATAALAPA